jgi:hypothetical protein
VDKYGLSHRNYERELGCTLKLNYRAASLKGRLQVFALPRNILRFLAAGLVMALAAAAHSPYAESLAAMWAGMSPLPQVLHLPNRESGRHFQPLAAGTLGRSE